MKSALKGIRLALVSGFLGMAALGSVQPASAGIFGDVGNFVGGAVRDVGRAADSVTRDVGRAAGSVTRDVGRAAGSVTRDVGRTVGNVFSPRAPVAPERRVLRTSDGAGEPYTPATASWRRSDRYSPPRPASSATSGTSLAAQFVMLAGRLTA